MISQITYLHHVYDPRFNLCTYFYTDYVGVDTCPGDSGGPLFCKRENKVILTGIVSWGAPQCGGIDQPGVYVNVTNYVSWIKDIVQDLPK